MSSGLRFPTSRAKRILKDKRALSIITVVVPVFVVGLIFAFEATVAISFLIIGLALLAISSDKAVKHSMGIATALKLRPLMIGLIVVSLGTDFPEIVNAIVSSALDQIDINVGDSFGSVFTQMTLVLGLTTFFGGAFKVKREETITLGTCLALAFMASVSIIEKGYITRLNSVFLVASWPLLMLISRNILKSPPSTDVRNQPNRRFTQHFILVVLGFVGVAVGAYVTVNSVISLSTVFSIPEYYISFFLVALGTSLPEMVVDLAAIRNKQYEIVIGDIIGSSIIDASFSIGMGTLFFPGSVSASIAETTGLYVLMSCIVVMAVIGLRQKHDKKSGFLFILLYFLIYVLTFMSS